ncbi:hypothetical protein GCM10009425_29530 [Pseudomonas asuensis]|uniref:Secreted protein n=2 Tax=Pseudomonas asuensis TaxID=1825787 RepID=A0ABQ2GW62_9PSED|nr:hypothetical protein GCM10009425_29530 [Pseudomonas asuensis]
MHSAFMLICCAGHSGVMRMMSHSYHRIVQRRDAVRLPMHDTMAQTASETIEQDDCNQYPGKRKKMGSD